MILIIFFIAIPLIVFFIKFYQFSRKNSAYKKIFGIEVTETTKEGQLWACAVSAALWPVLLIIYIIKFIGFLLRKFL